MLISFCFFSFCVAEQCWFQTEKWNNLSQSPKHRNKTRLIQEQLCFKMEFITNQVWEVMGGQHRILQVDNDAVHILKKSKWLPIPCHVISSSCANRGCAACCGDGGGYWTPCIKYADKMFFIYPSISHWLPMGLLGPTPTIYASYIKRAKGKVGRKIGDSFWHAVG